MSQTPVPPTGPAPAPGTEADVDEPEYGEETHGTDGGGLRLAVDEGEGAVEICIVAEEELLPLDLDDVDAILCQGRLAQLLRLVRAELREGRVGGEGVGGW